MANSFTYGNINAQIVVERQNVLFVSTAVYDDTSRTIAHGLKDGDCDSIRYAAQQMAQCLPENCILIPAPSRHGYAIQTLELASEISKISGSEVYDVLKGNARRANYECKKEGHPLSIAELGIRLDGCLPEGKVAVFIDNVVDTGTTAMAAANVLGSCVVLSYAMTSFLM